MLSYTFHQCASFFRVPRVTATSVWTTSLWTLFARTCSRISRVRNLFEDTMRRLPKTSCRATFNAGVTTQFHATSTLGSWCKCCVPYKITLARSASEFLTLRLHERTTYVLGEYAFFIRENRFGQFPQKLRRQLLIRSSATNSFYVLRGGWSFEI